MDGTKHKTYSNSLINFKWPSINVLKYERNSFFTWGDATLCRLGCLVYRNKNDLDKYYQHEFPSYNNNNINRSISSEYQVPDSIAPAVCVPYPAFTDSEYNVIDIACGHLWNAVLLSSGDIYGLGDLNRYPEFPDTSTTTPSKLDSFINLFRKPKSNPVSKTIDYVEEQTDWNKRCKAKPLTTLSNEKVEFVYLGEGGHTHLLALDSKSNIWLWDKTFCGPAIQLRFDFDRRDQESYQISKIQATQYYNAAIVEDYGLVVWFFDKRLQKLPGTISEDRTLRMDGTTQLIETILVPLPPGYSTNTITDFHCCDKFLVYVTEDGKLFAIDTSEPDSVTKSQPIFLKNIWETLQNLGKDVPNEPKVWKVVGGSKFIVAISDSDNLVFSSTFDDEIQSLSCAIALPELQGVGCVSVVGGESHFLALLKTGELLAWGLEKDLCGAFGMGLKVYKDNGACADLFMDKVTHVSTKSKVLAIGASGWHSCAVMCD